MVNHSVWHAFHFSTSKKPFPLIRANPIWKNATRFCLIQLLSRAFSCIFKSSLIILISQGKALQNKIASSAYIRCVMDDTFFAIFNPCIIPSASTYFNNLDNPSDASMNKYGDNGSPYLIPLGFICPHFPPFIRIEKDVVEMQLLISLHQFSQKPHALKISMM